MVGLTRERYQTEKVQRLTKRRDKIIEQIDGLLTRIDQFYARHVAQPILEYEEHEELERIHDRLAGKKLFIDPERFKGIPSAGQLDMAEHYLPEAKCEIERFEQRLNPEQHKPNRKN